MEKQDKPLKIADKGHRQGFLKRVYTNRLLLLMLLPSVLYVVIFHYIPMGGVLLAFKNYNFSKGFFGSPWCGFSNFRFLFISDKIWPLTRNTLLYNFAFIIAGMIMEVSFAIFINEIICRWFKKAFQSFMFLPYFISWVVVAVEEAVFGYDYGIINQLLVSLGIEKINIYVNAVWPFLLVLFRVWKTTGYGSIVYMAAITGINQKCMRRQILMGRTFGRKFSVLPFQIWFRQCLLCSCLLW